MITNFRHLQGLNIILDTNIFVDLTQEHLKKPLSELLDQLQANDKNTSYYSSNYSIFELFRGQPKKIINDYQDALTISKGIPIDENILVGAAQLMSLYKHINLISTASTNKIKSPEKIDDGDYIIASTAMLHSKTAILTRNYSDFPRPFFNEIYKHYLNYESNKKQGIEVYYLLKPDLDYAYKLLSCLN